MRSLILSILFVITSCGTVETKCSADTCPSGCCDSSGVCQSSSERSCGRGGQACVACLASQSCNLGVCIGFGGPIEPVGGGSAVVDAGVSDDAGTSDGGSAGGGASSGGSAGGGGGSATGGGSAGGGTSGGGSATGGGGSAAGGGSSGGGGACTPENDVTFCRRVAKTCGSVVDFDNCGNSRVVPSCGSCGPGSTCSASNVCICQSGFNFCQGQCRAEDAAMCGASCAVCPAPPGGTAQCLSGVCQSNCPSGSHLCGSSCVSNTSTTSCGNGCTPCPVPSNGLATCDGLSCGVSCNGGFHQCSGQCVSSAAVTSCGASCTPCQAPANATPSCNGTSCGFSCNAGFHLCGGACVPDTSTSACGASCQTCTAPSGASPTCSAGTCGFTCNAGFCAQGSSCVRFREASIPAGDNRPSLAVDANGLLHLAYVSSQRVALRTSQDGVSWTAEETVSSGQSVTELELAIDPLTQAPGLVAATPSAVWYFARSGSTFTSTTLWTRPTAGGYVSAVSLAIDAQGTPNVAYTLTEGTQASVKYTKRTGTTWSTAETAGVVVEDVDHDLIVNGGTVHLCFWSAATATRTLQYARRTTSWALEPVATATYDTYHASCRISLDASVPSIGYILQGPGLHTLKVASKPSTSWTSTTVETTSQPQLFAMSSRGAPIVGFTDAAGQPVIIEPAAAPLRSALGGTAGVRAIVTAPSGTTFALLTRSSSLFLARTCGP